MSQKSILCVKSSTIDLLLCYYEPLDSKNLEKYGRLKFRIKFRGGKNMKSLPNLNEELFLVSNDACKSAKNSLIHILYKEFLKNLDENRNGEAFNTFIEFNSNVFDRCYYYFDDESTNEFIKSAFKISPKE